MRTTVVCDYEKFVCLVLGHSGRGTGGASAARVGNLPPALVVGVRVEERASSLEHWTSAAVHRSNSCHSFFASNSDNRPHPSSWARQESGARARRRRIVTHPQASSCGQWPQPSPRWPAGPPAPGSRSRRAGTPRPCLRDPRSAPCRATRGRQPPAPARPALPAQFSGSARPCSGSRSGVFAGSANPLIVSLINDVAIAECPRQGWRASPCWLWAIVHRAIEAESGLPRATLTQSSDIAAQMLLTHHLGPHLRAHAIRTVALALPDLVTELGLGAVQTSNNLVIEFPVLSDDTCCQLTRPRAQQYAPLNTERLKHVSAPSVSSFGAGAGKESAYADAVPNGSVEDGVDAPDMVY